MAFWQNKEFKILFDVWQQKLKDSQFEDAEEGAIEGRVLKQRATNVYRAAADVVIEAKREYFILLAEHLQRQWFAKEVDRAILTLRANGHKICEIALLLEEEGTPRHPKTIRSVIRYYETLWGIKKWLPHQIRPQAKKKQ